MLGMARTVRSSVGSSNTGDRIEGITEAHGHMEPEFVEAAMRLGRQLSMSLKRWTVDDFWELLDARGFHTAHPKGMTGLLRRLQSERVIMKVGLEDLDHHRPSLRTNQSRLVQVYASLIHSDISSPNPV